MSDVKDTLLKFSEELDYERTTRANYFSAEVFPPITPITFLVSDFASETLEIAESSDRCISGQLALSTYHVAGQSLLTFEVTMNLLADVVLSLCANHGDGQDYGPDKYSIIFSHNDFHLNSREDLERLRERIRLFAEWYPETPPKDLLTVSDAYPSLPDSPPTAVPNLPSR